MKFSMQEYRTIRQTVSNRYNRSFKNDGNKTNYFEDFIEFHKNNTHMTKLVMSLKYYYRGNENSYTSFNEIEFQTFGISMLKAVKKSKRKYNRKLLCFDRFQHRNLSFLNSELIK